MIEIDFLKIEKEDLPFFGTMCTVRNIDTDEVLGMFPIMANAIDFAVDSTTINRRRCRVGHMNKEETA